MPTTTDPDPVALRPMAARDLPAAHALSVAARWPHRLVDWERMFRHAEGWVGEHGGEIVATGLRCLWGAGHATVGLVIVEATLRGRGIGRQVLRVLVDDLPDRTLLLHATPEGKALYEGLGFMPTGELAQHQGLAAPAPLQAPAPGSRLRPAGANDAAVLKALDAAARGMPREALIDDLLATAEACVVLDQDAEARGFAVLRRFGRGHVIGPVIAPDIDGAKTLIAHLAGLNAGRFTRIDAASDGGLADWLPTLGLVKVDAAATMVRGTPLASAGRSPRLFAITAQALG